MYSFAQRDDTRVVDEPLYGHYLRVSGAEHPGRQEILASMECDGETVAKEIVEGDFGAPVVFFKQMTHHLVDIDTGFLEKVINVFLIRDPRRIISSFRKVIPEVRMQDVGIEKQLHLYRELEAKSMPPVVIDSGQILKDPGKALGLLCESIGIPFYEKMLQWKAGPRKEDGVWAKYWYENVHRSSGFEMKFTEDVDIPDELSRLVSECELCYGQLFEKSIKV